MTPAARLAAASELLDRILDGEPAEKVLTAWGRRSRFAGSGDRAAVRDIVFGALRRKRSLAWLGGGETGRGLILGHVRAEGLDPADVFTGERHALAPLDAAEIAPPPALESAPQAVRCDCPDWLWPQLAAGLGDDAEAVLTVMRNRAPVFLRVNRAKAERDDAIAELAAEGIPAAPHRLSPTAIEVLDNGRRIQSSAAYREGRVELQDAASQAVVDAVLPHLGGGTVLDYCAGGGGKALALAAGGAGRVVAHDADPGRMADIPARAARAGAKIETAARPEGQFDVVLCDAPCSGSGAWRRQPEAKWRLTPERLADLNRTQDAILDAAAGHVARGGFLAYATCSLLRAENDDRVNAFLAARPDWKLVRRLRLTPLDGGDGFFAAVLARRGDEI